MDWRKKTKTKGGGGRNKKPFDFIHPCIVLFGEWLTLVNDYYVLKSLET